VANVVVVREGTPDAGLPGAFVCDGVDDDIEINAAISAAAADGGGTVEIKAGTYSISSAITVLDDNTHIQGAGAGQTVLEAAADLVLPWHPNGGHLSGVVSFCAVDNFSCRGITVDALTNGVHCNGIIAIPDGTLGAGNVCSNGVIADNAVYLAPGFHNYLLWSLRGNHIEITDNLADGGSTVANAHPSQEGIEVWGGDDVLIAGNTVRNIGGNALNIGGLGYQVETPLTNVTIEDNDIQSSRVGILLFSMYAEHPGDLSQISILNNRIEQATEFGIAISNPSGNALEPPSVEAITISGNDINMAVEADAAGALASGIMLLNSSAVPGGPLNTLFADIQITNNTITETVTEAVYDPEFLKDGLKGNIVVYGFSDVLFASNEIDIAAPRPESIGIQVLYSSDLVMSGNVIDGSGSSSVVVASSSDFAFTNNSFLNWNQGESNSMGALLAQVSSGFTFDNNRFSTSKPTAGAIVQKNPVLATGSFEGNTYVSSIDAQLPEEFIANLTLIGAAISGTGNAFDNIITGNSQNNNLEGGGGEDVLVGGAGNDVMTGGPGDDFIYVDGSSDCVIEAANGGMDQVYASASYTLEASHEIETLSRTILSEYLRLISPATNSPIQSSVMMAPTVSMALRGMIPWWDGAATTNSSAGQAWTWPPTTFRDPTTTSVRHWPANRCRLS
jgi:hypothetical protein